MTYDPREIAGELQRRAAEHSPAFAQALQLVISGCRVHRLFPEEPDRQDKRRQAERVLRATAELRDSLWDENAKSTRSVLVALATENLNAIELQRELQQGLLDRLERDTERLADAARRVIQQNRPAPKGENARRAAIITGMRGLFATYGVPWTVHDDGAGSTAVLAAAVACDMTPAAAKKAILRLQDK
jgi:hypothetical protein